MLRSVEVTENTIHANIKQKQIDSSLYLAQYVQTLNNAMRNSFSERGRVVFFDCFEKNKNRCLPSAGCTTTIWRFSSPHRTSKRQKKTYFIGMHSSFSNISWINSCVEWIEIRGRTNCKSPRANQYQRTDSSIRSINEKIPFRRASFQSLSESLSLQSSSIFIDQNYRLEGCLKERTKLQPQPTCDGELGPELRLVFFLLPLQ